jgi:hypothetical protein
MNIRRLGYDKISVTALSQCCQFLNLTGMKVSYFSVIHHYTKLLTGSIDGFVWRRLSSPQLLKEEVAPGVSCYRTTLIRCCIWRCHGDDYEKYCLMWSRVVGGKYWIHIAKQVTSKKGKPDPWLLRSWHTLQPWRCQFLRNVGKLLQCYATFHSRTQCSSTFITTGYYECRWCPYEFYLG